MNKLDKPAIALFAALLVCSGCKSGPSYRVYVSNEASGDLTVIDPVRMEAVETVPWGSGPAEYI